MYRLCTAVVLALGAFIATTRAEQPSQKPNIVFILADDLGINDLGCYGRKDQHTPNLDKLAKEGTRFTTFYCAQPICSPSRAALMTGRTPARLHLTTFLPGRPDAPSQKLLHPKINMQLPLEEKTIAKLLKGGGYKSACLGKWHLGGAGFMPKDHGFDEYYAGKQKTTPSETEGGKGEYDLTHHAETFITENKDRPFFLYLAHYTPHIPLGAKAGLIAKAKDSFNPTYAAMIYSLDDCVGKVLAKLDELKLTEKTLFVFSSDNGGLHVPEGEGTPSTHNTPYRAGKGFLYEGGLRVPLIVRWPGQVLAGRVVDTPLINTDLVPTFLDVCGVAPQGQLDGVSLMGVLRGKEITPRSLMWHFPHYTNQGSKPAGAIRDGDWKLIEYFEDGQLELYNLAKDPSETHDLAMKEPEKAKALLKKLAGWRRAIGAQNNTPNPNFDAAMHKRLYVDMDISQLKPLATAAAMRPMLEAWRKGMLEAVNKPGKPEED